MKILYVITSTDVGGAEKALLQLVTDLSSKKHTVKVISLKACGPIAKQLEELGVEVKSLYMSYGGIGVVSALSAEIASFKPDIVHAMLYRAIEFSRCACAGKKCKLIATPHFDLSKKNFLLRWVDRFLKIVDTYTVAESKATFSYLTEHQKYDSRKVSYIGNSPAKGRFFSDKNLRQQMRKRYGYTDKNLVFICVARMAPVKNGKGLITAFSRVYNKYPYIRLVWVGDGPQQKDISELIHQLNLQRVVSLVGEQSNVNDWLNMADVFVLNSKEESLPLALLESLQVGKPCLVTNVGDMPLWVIQGKNGYVYKAGSEVLLCCFLAEMAEKYRTETDFLTKMGNKSLEIAQNIKDTSQQYERIYTQLMEESFHVKTL